MPGASIISTLTPLPLVLIPLSLLYYADYNSSNILDIGYIIVIIIIM